MPGTPLPPHPPPSYRVSTSGRRNGKTSFHEILYNSDIVLSVKHDGTIHIIKNRYDATTGVKPLGTVIDIMSRMLACAMFKGHLKMFQEGLKQKLVKEISKILIKEGGENFEDSIQRTSE